jgi:hypothetical protein
MNEKERQNNEAPEGNRYYVFSITIMINEIKRLRRELILRI